MKTKTIKAFFLCLVMVGILTASAASTALAASDTIQLKYAGLLPPGMTLSAPVDEWGKLVEERTNGKVKLTTYHAQALGKFQEFPKMVHAGLCEMAFMGPPTPGFELVGVYELPLITPSQRIGMDVLHAIDKQGLFKSIFEDKGFKPMFYMNSDPRYLWFCKKQVTSLDQLKGLKLRGTTPVHIEVAKALGATAVFISPADIYMALERGTVDGAVSSAVGTFSLKLDESLRHCLWEQVSSDVGVVVMSLKVWNSLPADVRLVMQDVNEEMRYRYLEYYKSEAEYLAQAKEKGIEITRLDPSEKARLVAALKPVAGTWADKLEKKGYPARKVLEEMIKLSEQY